VKHVEDQREPWASELRVFASSLFSSAVPCAPLAWMVSNVFVAKHDDA
jgi:hypothetical protein